jgi:uncharacterized protein (UPF0332 family)
MTPDIHALVAHELARGDEAYRAAEVLLRESLLRDALSRAYYAALHFARALLLTRGEEPLTHDGVVQRFSLHFVRGGIVTVAEGKVLGRLQRIREEVDYIAERDYDQQHVLQELESVRDFRAAVVRVLEAEGAWPLGQ